jgi:putative transcriptional regulator
MGGVLATALGALDTMSMTVSTSLTNQLLIAMPGLQDPNFSRTVTYICEHTDQGAMGIVINRPMDIRLGEVLAQLEIPSGDRGVMDTVVYLGGPVQPDRGFVLHTGRASFDSTLSITPEISVTTSKDVLEAIAEGRGPEQTLIALGYAGWAGGQLEDEMSANAWLSGPADTSIIFRLPAETRWQAAAQLLGVDLNLLSGEAGHA